MSATGKAVLDAVSGLKELPLVRYVFELTDVADAGWRVRRVELREGLSEVYDCILDLATSDLNADADVLEGATCLLQMERGASARRLCGMVTRVEWQGTMVNHLLVRVHVRPALAALEQTRDSRIFQQQSVKEILEQVLSDGLAPYQRKPCLSLDRDYKPREYCTQYAESDLEFVLRLMSEEGIFFFFDHSGDKEELVLVDMNEKCPPYESADGNPVSVVGPEAPMDLLKVETIGRLSVGREMRSTGMVLRDFDWTRPGLDLTFPKGKADVKGYERNVYDYPAPQIIADYDAGQKKYTRDEGSQHAGLRKEELDARKQVGTGESNVTGLSPGLVLEVGGQHLPQLSTKYLITHVEHFGEAADVIEHQMEDVKGGGAQRERYRNRFTCIRLDAPYRPSIAKPAVVHGPQTATVVGPAGEEIFTDEHGRIKVQFHWDRMGAKDDHSSCWIRVAQIWGGASWGFLFLPRIGMEVVVQFLEGNPDRPLVTGCVYNGTHPPPYDLPAKKTVSTIKSSSSPGGNGSNEIKFEDAAGSEEFFIHAQKDMNAVVKNNRSASVGADDSTSVGGNQSISVKKNRTLGVDGDQSITVKGNQTVTIQGGGSGAVHSATSVTGKYGLDASDTIEIQAPTHIKLTCGGSSILVEPGKITLQAGAGSKVVLDANALMQSSQGSKVLLDANALTQSVPGSKVLLDANALTQSSVGAKTLHDANVLSQAVPGASVLLDANATVTAPANATVRAGAAATVQAGTAATVQGGASATVASPTSTLAGAGGAVVANGAGVTAAGGKVDVSGGMVNISGGLVKIN